MSRRRPYAVSWVPNTAVIDDLDSGNWNVSVTRDRRDLKRESLTKAPEAIKSGEAVGGDRRQYFVMAAVPAAASPFEFGPRQATLQLGGAQKPADLKPGDPLTAVLDASGRVVRVERQRGVAVPSRNDGERIVVGKVAAVSGAQGTLQLETRHIARVLIPGAGGSAPDKIRVYLGPKERDRLAQMNARRGPSISAGSRSGSSDVLGHEVIHGFWKLRRGHHPVDRSSQTHLLLSHA
jgi:hypothetical protein